MQSQHILAKHCRGLLTDKVIDSDSTYFRNAHGIDGRAREIRVVCSPMMSDSRWKQAVEVCMRFAELYFVEKLKRSDIHGVREAPGCV